MLTNRTHGRGSCIAVLRRDMQLYVFLSQRLFLAPTPFMLKFMGADAADLADRRGTDAVVWAAFRAEVTLNFPSIPSWTSTTARDGQLLNSVVERVAYEALQRQKPPSMTLKAHPILHPKRKWRADFGVTSVVQGSMLHIEVAGLIASDGRPRNEREAAYQRHLRAKLGVYAQVGLHEPVVIYIDIIVDPVKLQAAIDQVLARVGEGVP